jgi:VanZ family protein
MAVSVMAAILLVLLYRLIFVFSGQDGEESGSLSAVISEKCAELLNAISGKHWTQNVLDSMAAYFEHPIRKLAHFSEYACMGVLLYGVWRPWKERGRKLYLLIVCWVFVSAGADEFHQLFVPGRYGCFADVVLDTCGGVFGLFVCVCVEKMVRRRKQKSGF